MEPENSKLGLASFRIAIITTIFFSVVLIWNFGAPYQSDLGTLVIVCMSLAIPALSVIACVLGILGLLRKDRRKIYAVLGVLLSIIVLISHFVLLWYEFKDFSVYDLLATIPRIAPVLFWF